MRGGAVLNTWPACSSQDCPPTHDSMGSSLTVSQEDVHGSALCEGNSARCESNSLYSRKEKSSHAPMHYCSHAPLQPSCSRKRPSRVAIAMGAASRLLTQATTRMGLWTSRRSGEGQQLCLHPSPFSRQAGPQCTGILIVRFIQTQAIRVCALFPY